MSQPVRDFPKVYEGRACDAPDHPVLSPKGVADFCGIGEDAAHALPVYARIGHRTKLTLPEVVREYIRARALAENTDLGELLNGPALRRVK